MKIKDIIERTTQHLRQKGFDSARLDAELLFSHALKMKRIDLYLHFDKPLSEAELELCRDVVKRRSQGEPIAYICGAKEFFKSTFAVGPGVLIPRPETEMIVEKILDLAKARGTDEGLRILELGAGTGCLSISLAKELPRAQVVAIENSKKAVEYFLTNKANLQCDNVKLIEENIFELSQDEMEPFDYVISNPPYISSDDPNVHQSVKQFEPAEALFSEENGLRAIRVWSSLAMKVLKPEGVCLFEIGTTQGQAVADFFMSTKLATKVQVLKDYAGHDRVVLAEKKKQGEL